MPVYKGLKQEIKSEQIVRLMGYSNIDNVDQKVVDLIEKSIKKAQYCQPSVIYQVTDDFYFSASDKLNLSSEQKLTGDKLNRFRACEKILIAVITAGNYMEELIDEARERDPLAGYVMDMIGGYMVEIMSEEFWKAMKNKYNENNYNTTSFLSPGNKNFSLREQRTIFSYLKPEQIGVTLNESCLMTPVKSLSILMGIGKNINQAERAHNCKKCDLKDCFLRGLIH